jgi:hypothetical protein
MLEDGRLDRKLLDSDFGLDSGVIDIFAGTKGGSRGNVSSTPDDALLVYFFTSDSKLIPSTQKGVLQLRLLNRWVYISITVRLS